MASRSKPETAPAAAQPQELLSIDTLREKHKVTRPHLRWRMCRE